MTREEIIRLAEEAGFEVERLSPLLDKEVFEIWLATMIKFAALIAAAEREACARVCRDLGRGHDVAFAEFDCVEAIRARGKE